MGHVAWRGGSKEGKGDEGVRQEEEGGGGCEIVTYAE